MTFGELLKAARTAKGMTQKQVAQAVGIQLNHYQHFEYSKRVPSSEIMIKLVRFFDFDLDEVNEILENK